MIYLEGFFLHGTEVTHTREVYNGLDYLGDIAGIFELFKLLVGALLFKISLFSYNLKAFEKLYLVSTLDPSLV